MAPRVDPIPADPDLPPRADVVVIGGGIIGTSTAFFLAQKGISVALCEKGHIAGEQSSRNWGFCRQQGRDPRELPLIVESLRIWRNIDRTIEGDTGFRQSGIVYLAEDDKAPPPTSSFSTTPAPISWTRGGSPAPSWRRCCQARRARGRMRSTPPVTAAPSRRRRRPPSPPRCGAWAARC
jgi:glycine/D-amino acid oxidase-like deaminating enzyme